MKRWLIALALCSVVARPAQAQLNLAWNNCITQPSAAANLDYACDGSKEGFSFRIVPSFIAPAGIPAFLGVEITLQFSTASPVLPDFWRMGAGECRDGGVNIGGGYSLVGTGSTGACQNPYLGGGVENGYSYSSGVPAPNLARMQTAPVRTGSPVALTPGQQYFADVLVFNITGDVDLGDGHVCPGCSTPACLVLQEIEIYQAAPQSNVILTASATRNYITWQNGAATCAAATPTRNRTWGSIKAIYR